MSHNINPICFKDGNRYVLPLTPFLGLKLTVDGHPERLVVTEGRTLTVVSDNAIVYDLYANLYGNSQEIRARLLLSHYIHAAETADRRCYAKYNTLTHRNFLLNFKHKPPVLLYIYRTIELAVYDQVTHDLLEASDNSTYNNPPIGKGLHLRSFVVSDIHQKGGLEYKLSKANFLLALNLNRSASSFMEDVMNRIYNPPLNVNSDDTNDLYLACNRSISLKSFNINRCILGLMRTVDPSRLKVDR